MTTASLSLSALRDAPLPTSAETMQRVSRLVSDRVGIISEVVFQELSVEDPAVYWATARPADLSAVVGRPAMNRGNAASVEPSRAVAKAVGETVERYCSAQWHEDRLVEATYEELDADAVPPGSFALFAEDQYREPGFWFQPLAPDAPVRWVQGFSLVDDRPRYVPAIFVYVPYERADGEVALWFPISTGLACGPTLAAALYKGVLEAVERDAFMIVWQNRLPRPRIDLESVGDPFARRLLEAIEGLPTSCHAIVLTLDIDVTVILVVLVSESGSPPFTVLGLGTDLDPRRALVLALEEALLSLCGMTRSVARRRGYRSEPDYRDVVTLELHGLAHALDPLLRPGVEFLTKATESVALDDLSDRSSASALANLRTVVDHLEAAGLDVVAVDLTTADIDDVGLKVVRAVVPGLQPLDNDHTRRYLGGRRLYEVPRKLGLVDRPIRRQDLNPDPHPFP